MKQLILTTLMSGAVALGMQAAIPEGYYTSLEGKSGAALSEAIAAIAAGHTEISYGNSTWDAFTTTDVIEVRGRKAWRDMYSNNLVYLPGHDAMNIEHTVANSWWGGVKTIGAYMDLFHLNPSDQAANGKKSNLPPGKVAEAKLLDNGIILIGTGAEGYGGGAPNVYEPTDENKGDFARAIFYVFTAYPEISWKTESPYMYEVVDGKAKISDWALSMLLEWDRLDPVDSREKARNEAIYALQNNRNPFIDIANLAQVLYSNTEELLTVTETTPVDRPEAPAFGAHRLVGLNTYTGRYWGAKPIEVTGTNQLWVSVDNAPFALYDGGLMVDAATQDGDTHTIKAYVVDPAVVNVSGTALRSPISSIKMRAYDPNITDWSLATWEPVSSVDQIDTDTYYIILSANTLHSMSAEGGVTSKFMSSAGAVDFSADGINVTELPVDAAIVKFSLSGSDTHPYALGVYDINGNFKGYWNTVAKNSMKLDTEAATAATVAMKDDNFRMEFAQYGRLQFNKSQPRFLNYESTQGEVKLYRFGGFNTDTAVESPEAVQTQPVIIDGRSIIAPAGSYIFDLGGRQVSGQNLRPGVYAVATPGARAVKVVIR